MKNQMTIDFDALTFEEAERLKKQLEGWISHQKSKILRGIANQIADYARSENRTFESVLDEIEAILFSDRRRGPKPPKYRDPDTGQTWAGRGKFPVWLRQRLDHGARIEDFLVNDDDADE